MSTQEFEYISAGAPLCRIRVISQAGVNSDVRSACQKLLKPHSIGDVPEFKGIIQSPPWINIGIEFNPRERFNIQVRSRDRMECESCGIPNEPFACAHMIWLVEKIARFQFQVSYGPEQPRNLTISGDGRVAEWEEHSFRIESTFQTLKSHRSSFQDSLLRQLELQRVYVTLDPHPIDGDATTSQVWRELGGFLAQLPLEDGIPRVEFLRMHFDKVRRWLQHTIASENFNGIVYELHQLDLQTTKNLARAIAEGYSRKEHLNDAADVLVHVLSLVNHDTHGGRLWREIAQTCPDFFLATLGYIQAGPTLQRETLAALRAGLDKAWRAWGDYLPETHSRRFPQFLGA